jgi:flagellar hook-associated protein 2
MGNGTSATFIVGSGSDSAVPGTYYTDNTDEWGVNNGNTLAGLEATINAASRPMLGYSGTAGQDDNGTSGSSTTTSYGSLTAISNENDTLTGSITIQVGSGTAQTVTLDSSGETLSQLVTDINGTSDIGVTASIVQDSSTGLYSLSLVSGTPGSAGTLTVTASVLDTNTVGVNAGIVTSNGESTLTLGSQLEGANGALTVTSALTANAPATIGYTDAGYTSDTADSGTFDMVQSSGDTLTGDVTIQVGDGTPQTITLDSSDNSLSGLMDSINNAKLGVNATLNSAGTALTLTSGTNGADGALTVTPNFYDTTNITSTTLKYNNSSDIGSITTLGISINNDGSLSFDANSLDSTLNTDFSSVVGFFQNVDSWGQAFSGILTNAGSSSSTGILHLASSSNSNIESSLNAKISSEESIISAEQVSLTAELNSANEIMQELPSQLQGIDELYSAITGYNQSTNG